MLTIVALLCPDGIRFTVLQVEYEGWIVSQEKFERDEGASRQAA
jgi:hypothetical protein